MMFNNQRLRWERDNGVYLPMLEDTARNQFYDNVFSKTVNNKNCIDVGFGTGLLSLLAIKHGAKHITAYEHDHNRYLLAKHIVSHLELEDRITLVNKLFVPSEVTASHEILFHETIDSNLWVDGLFGLLPSQLPILPEKYSCDFYLIEITPSEYDQITNSTAISHEDEEIWKEFYNSIKGADWPDCPVMKDFNQLPDWVKQECFDHNCSYVSYGVGKHTFNPGVEIDIGYKKEIENLINNYYELPENKKIYEREEALSKHEYRKYINRGIIVSHYEFDSNTKKFAGTIEQITDTLLQMVVPHSVVANKITLIIPHYKVKSHGFELDLSLSPSACWHPPRWFAIAQNPSGPVIIQQCLFTGEVSYWID